MYHDAAAAPSPVVQHGAGPALPTPLPKRCAADSPIDSECSSYGGSYRIVARPRVDPGEHCLVDLSIASKGLIGKLGNLLGGHSGEIGDPEFDKVFSVKASNLAQVAALLDPAARKALLEVAAEGLHPALDPHSIHLRRFSGSAVSDSAQVIERDFREAARLARVIGDSFARAEL